MLFEPEFWVAVAFVILMGLFAYLGVHRTVLQTLDHRSERIKSELDEARRLKEEAAKLLAVGEVTVVRAGNTVALGKGATIERGDLVRAARGKAQIGDGDLRESHDESSIALGAG